MTKNDYVETELHGASNDLATGLDAAVVPPFTPTRRKSPAVAAVLLLAMGGVYLGAREDASQTIRTPVADETSTIEDAETPVPESSIVERDDDVPLAVFGQDATLPSPNDRAAAGLLEWTVDPAYGSEIRQFTTAEDTRFDVVTDPNRMVENPDGSLVLTYHGSDGYRVADRETGEVLGPVDVSLLSEPHWHPTNPALLRHLPDPGSAGELLRLLETDVFTGETEIIADVSGRVRNVESNGIVWPDGIRMSTKEQGAPSADGSIWAWIIDDADGQPLGVLTYDFANQSVLGRGGLRTDVGAVDYVSVSPTGQFVVVAYADAIFVYDQTMNDERQLSASNDSGDFALNTDGSEAFVIIDFGPDDDSGWLLSIDLETLERTRIFDVFEAGNTSMSISGRAFDKPGWVVVSTYDCKVDQAWTCDKVMAVEMLSEGRIVNLAHTYSCAESFWAQPIAVPSMDLSRVYFNSDSGSCGDDGEVFQLRVPEFE